MVVDANARGRGVGAFLVQQIEEWARERGAERVTLTSASHRTDAYKFYEAIGYQVTGTRFMKRV
jgi:GNAT superfamily N-acetyltransferase